MAEQIEFTDQDRELLKQILITLELNQTQLSDLADVYQSWLSQVIGGKRTQIKGNLFEKVVNALVEKAKIFRQEQKLSDNKIIEIADFLSRFSDDAKELLPSQIYSPGGIVGIGAGNYIERDVDQKVINALKTTAFALLISGPFHCGKSSLLARLQYEAREIKIETVWFNPEKHLPFDLSEEKSEADLNSIIAKALSRELSKEWNLELPLNEADDIYDISSLLDWLEIVLEPTKSENRLLIIDDLGSLGLSAAEEWTQLFALDVHNKQRSSGGKLNIAFGLTWGFDSSAKRKIRRISSIVSWSPKIELTFFSQDEVKILIDQLGIFVNQKKLAKDLFQLFSGQPYLTHFAIENPDFYEATKSWTNDKTDSNSKDLIVKSRAFTQRLAAFKGAFLGPTLSWSKESEDLLQIFISVCENPKTTLTPDFKALFEKLYLLDKNNRLLVELDFLIAKKLQEDFKEEFPR